MKTITLKNFPEDLLGELKARARNNKRSLNGEIIHILERTRRPSALTRQDIMKMAKTIRESVRQRLADHEVRAGGHENRS